MDIRTNNLPMAGQAFQFDVEDGIGIINIQVFVDSKLILKNDCDDPPCHEMAMIPTGTRGATLRVIASDSSGNTQTFEYQVADSDAGASGMMTMGG